MDANDKIDSGFMEINRFSSFGSFVHRFIRASAIFELKLSIFQRIYLFVKNQKYKKQKNETKLFHLSRRVVVCLLSGRCQRRVFDAFLSLQKVVSLSTPLCLPMQMFVITVFIRSFVSIENACLLI